VADHHRLRAVPRAFSIVEPAPNRGTHAEQGEEVLRYRHFTQPSCLDAGFARQLGVADAIESHVRGHLGERPVELRVREIRAYLRCLLGQSCCLLTSVRQPSQSLGIGEWKRAKQQRVRNAEDGRARADAERDDADGEHGEAGVALECAQRIAEIVYDTANGFAHAHSSLSMCR